MSARYLWVIIGACLVLGCGGEETDPENGAGGAAPEGCAPGSMPTGDDASPCLPPGIPPEDCAVGFTPLGDGCEVVLPAEDCPEGTMAIPGETACREVAPCGTTTWGEIPIAEPGTVFVDGSYLGGDGDGTEAKPFVTIQEGIDAAGAGVVVAVAEGIYDEDVVITGKPVRLWGRCPALVEVHGAGGPAQTAIYVRQGADGSEVRSLAVTGPAVGVFVRAAGGVSLDRLWVHHTGMYGITLQDDLGPAAATVRGCLVDHTASLGIFTGGATVEVADSVIRDVEMTTGGTFGQGVSAAINPQTMGRASLTVRSSVVRRNHDVGIRVSGSDAHIEGTLVKDTLPQGIQATGWGIDVQEDNTTGAPSTGTVQQSLVEGSHEVGIAVIGSQATIEHTVVRHGQPAADDQRWGRGINIHTTKPEQRSNVVVRSSVVAHNRDIAIQAQDSDLTVEHTVVRDTLSQAADLWFGRGITVQTDPDVPIAASLLLRFSTVVAHRDVGVILLGATTGRIESSYVALTAVREADATLGDGLVAQSGNGTAAQLEVIDSVIADNARAGVGNFGSVVALQSSQFRCNAIQLNGEEQNAGPFSYDDRGGNLCGCDEPLGTCQVLSAGLQPPDPVSSP